MSSRRAKLAVIFHPTAPLPMFFLVIPALLFPLLFATAGAAFAAGMLSWRRRRMRQRRAELAALAERRQLSFREKDDFGLLTQLKSFDLFRRERRWIGRNGRIFNVLQGKVGETDVYLFDYTYVISTGKSSRRITQTVFFANDKRWFLPNFRLKPETWWHKVLDRLGSARDINFPDHPEFSGRFWLTGEFDDLIREQFSTPVRQFLAQRPPAHLEGNNYYLIAYKPGKSLDSQEAEIFFEQGCQLMELLQKEGKMELLNLAELKAPEPLEALKMPDLADDGRKKAAR